MKRFMQKIGIRCAKEYCHYKQNMRTVLFRMCISSKSSFVELSVAGCEKNAPEGDKRQYKEPQGEKCTQHTRGRMKGEQKQDGIWSPSLALLCVRREAEDNIALGFGTLFQFSKDHSGPWWRIVFRIRVESRSGKWPDPGWQQ